MRLFFVFVLVFFAQLHSMSDVERLMSEASAHNSFFLYEKAVQFLDEAIKIAPFEKEAYKERAFSYFELNRIDLALEDYYRIRKNRIPYATVQCSSMTLCSISPYSQLLDNASSSLEFAKGLLYGTMLGAREGTIEFVSSIRGGLTFLWSFACSPLDVSKELVQALYDMGAFLASGQVYMLLQEALPEFFECGEYWDTWSDFTKGQKLGFIVGKYSILVFYYFATADVGVHFYNSLRRANIMAILERYSVTKSVCILEESAKHAKKSMAVLKKAQAGSIVPHNPNVLPHVFTKKHHWDKFITVTGNHEKDFEQLAMFLEKQRILQCERSIDWSHQGVITYKYTKQMGKDRIVALFEINEQNLTLLRNAWVEVGVPYVP